MNPRQGEELKRKYVKTPTRDGEKRVGKIILAAILTVRISK